MKNICTCSNIQIFKNLNSLNFNLCALNIMYEDFLYFLQVNNDEFILSLGFYKYEPFPFEYINELVDRMFNMKLENYKYFCPFSWYATLHKNVSLCASYRSVILL